ncbi:MAG: UbiA family prenyltransferase [Gammaproteobacteria bacterium]|nr:UbiA family prenyltransferase [Gammaproteobacteria bacterium]
MPAIHTAEKYDADPPLLVDLDGTLIKTDTLLETAVLYVKENPLQSFRMFAWLLRGKQVLKMELANRVRLNVESLPCNEEVVDYLQLQYKFGRKIVLCTGTWIGLARKIAARFPFIENVIATDSNTNLTGGTKAQWIRQQLGERGYDYIGNEPKDMAVWKLARKALVVGSPDLAEAASRVSALEKHFPDHNNKIRNWLKAIRIHQWAKNGLIFVPLLVSQSFMHFEAVTSALVAFLSFGFCASATYLLNDLADLESDRKHSIKKARPLAAGLIPIQHAIAAIAVLLLLGLGTSILFLNSGFFLVLSGYLTLTILYSFRLKQVQTVDVIVLASLFTTRVVAGAAAIGVFVSFWLLSFSMFLFLSLAMVKRVSELIHVEKDSHGEMEKISGRGYFTADIVVLQSLGGTAGFMSVLVLALYINSPEVMKLYRLPEILWIVVPLIGYWIMRIWIITARGQMNEDPISYAIRNKNSWFVATAILLVMIAAIIL